MVAHSTVADIHRQYLLQDEGGFAILVLTIVSAAASVGAVFGWIEMATRAETFSKHGLALLFMTTLLYWAFIHIMFARCITPTNITRSIRGKGGGLRFPGTAEPGYWDFLYLAFAIGTATPSLRRRGDLARDPQHRDRARHCGLRVQRDADRADRLDRGRPHLGGSRW